MYAVAAMYVIINYSLIFQKTTPEMQDKIQMTTSLAS